MLEKVIKTKDFAWKLISNHAVLVVNNDSSYYRNSYKHSADILAWTTC